MYTICCKLMPRYCSGSERWSQAQLKVSHASYKGKPVIRGTLCYYTKLCICHHTAPAGAAAPRRGRQAQRRELHEISTNTVPRVADLLRAGSVDVVPQRPGYSRAD